jgi:hypothetical protein
MRNGINKTDLFFKIPSITIHEWQMGIDDIIPNKHEWYLSFTLDRYYSYFIKEMSPHYLVHSVKYYWHFLLNLV